MVDSAFDIHNTSTLFSQLYYDIRVTATAGSDISCGTHNTQSGACNRARTSTFGCACAPHPLISLDRSMSLAQV